MDQEVDYGTWYLLANALELTALISKEVVGNSVADAIDGKELTTQVLLANVSSNFQSALIKAGAL